MDPRRLALLAGLVTTVVLGVAVIRIMPREAPRIVEPAVPATPLRATIRDVTPGPGDPPASSTIAAQAQPAPPPPPAATQAPTAPTSPPPAAPPVPAPPAASAPVPTPNARRPAPPRPASVEVLPDNEDLRERVGSMRERLMLAARSGDIGRLGVVFQMNETLPVFTRGGERDPVAFWKKASGDGEGREILAILLNILDLPPALINKGTPQEMYVWPYLAHVPLADLSPRQSVDLYRLMTAQDVRDMRTLGSWVFWRLGIGPDGTVHFFLAGE